MRAGILTICSGGNEKVAGGIEMRGKVRTARFGNLGSVKILAGKGGIENAGRRTEGRGGRTVVAGKRMPLFAGIVILGVGRGAAATRTGALSRLGW